MEKCKTAASTFQTASSTEENLKENNLWEKEPYNIRIKRKLPVYGTIQK
jgi:hypothetical protein